MSEKSVPFQRGVMMSSNIVCVLPAGHHSINGPPVYSESHGNDIHHRDKDGQNGVTETKEEKEPMRGETDCSTQYTGVSE